MKRLYFLFSTLIVSGFAFAQTEKQAVSVTPNKDTTSVNKQLQQTADLKTMDAVKTSDHPKPVPVKPKNASKTKDTTKVKKNAQR